MPDHSAIRPIKRSKRKEIINFKVPGYQIEEILSENTAFTIYRGWRSEDSVPVLIKILNQENPSPKQLAPVWQEFETLRLLDLPGVEKAYALENHQQRWMIVLNDDGGRPISDLELAGRMEPEEFVNLALQLVENVEGIHAHQIIHKNISPHSIFYNPSTHLARLTNFGYASLVSSERLPFQSPYRLSESLAYISPELTGRINRSVDYRTDYYSLGATLYELLTGTPPFRETSSLELVHAHLAIIPESPEVRMESWTISSQAFRIISLILLKLLEKNPEDRYQSPGALKVDLRQCLSVLEQQDQELPKRTVFVPGQLDYQVELKIQRVVVGREQESETLLQALQRTIHGSRELILVTGETGVGKTTLVNQLLRPVTEQNGLFLYAKYAQTRHTQVYPLLTETLEEFCRIVLSEPTLSFRSWQEKIQAAVSPNGQLLIDLCPQLGAVLGAQPPVEPVSEDLARDRFHQIVIRFLQALCRPDQPLVIFLDDLEWINRDSALLWNRVLFDSTLRNLLVIGAFPDDKVDSEHPIHSLVQDEQTVVGKVTWLHLRNLELHQIQRLIAIALDSKPSEISELSSLVYQKTHGNPYFSTEFLKSLYKDQLLVFQAEEQKWHWNADKIDEYGIAENVVDFFVHEIVNLDENTQKILQYSALLGRRFDAADLLAVLDQENARLLAAGLWQGIKEGLIYPLDANYRSLAWESKNRPVSGFGGLLPSLVDLLEEHILFEFADAHVQKAAIARLTEQQIRQSSLEIGWRLLEKAEQAGQETLQKNLLLIVDHLNEGFKLIQDPIGATKAAQLNLMAGQKARTLTAFRAAFAYLSTGIQLLPFQSWLDQYALTFDLFTAGAEVAKLNGDLAYAEELALAAGANASTLLEKVRIMNIRMDIHMIQNQLDKVVELGIEAIRLLDFELEVQESPASIIEQIIQLPTNMTDSRALAVSSLVEPLISASYARNTKWFVKILHFYIDLFSRYGNPPSAGHVYIIYAVDLLGKFQTVEQGCRIGRMALELAESQGPSKTLYTVRFIYYAFINHWLVPARESLALLEENARLAFQFGTLEFSKNSLDIWYQNSLFLGEKLDRLKSSHARAAGQLWQSRLHSFRLKVWSQVVLRLSDESPRAMDLPHSLFDEDEEEEIIHLAGQNQIRWFNLYTAQAMLSLLFREPQQALRASVSADAIRVDAMTHLLMSQHLFIYSLALLSEQPNASEMTERLRQVEKNLHLMRLWASLVPQNYKHHVELVEAELARTLGHKQEAARKYDRAIQDARQNEYIHESALAAELAAEFYLAEGDTLAARNYLQDAYSSYLAWGAKAKLQDLINRYPDWLPLEIHKEKRGMISSAKDRTSNELAVSIDLNTILKASMELIQETSLEELLRKMMEILIKNAGAQNGSLILHQNDRWFLKVQGSTDLETGFALLSTPLEYLSPQVSKSYIPVSIIHYVINLKEDLVLEDASASRQFNRDAYIQNRRPKSVLCAPLLNQGMLIGVVYLENNLTTGVFTSDRLEMVRLISAQAAASIEKARLYETMEMEVQDRTRELSDANRRLREEINRRIRIEEALRLSEARYRTVFESTGTAMALIDEDGNISLVNEKYLELTGYSSEELANQFDAMNVIAPSDLTRIKQSRMDMLADPFKVPYSFEFQLVDKTGVEKPVIATTTFLPGSHAMIVSLIDITERKRAEEALRYNEALLRKVLDILPVGVWILDKDSRVIRGNPEALRIWSGLKYVTWQDYDHYKAWRSDTGEPITSEAWAARRAIDTGEITLDEELEIEAFDGTHRVVLNSAMRLATEEDGLIGAIAVNQDITERKRNEKELRAAHDQLSTLLDISQSLVSTLNIDRLLNLIIEQLGKVIPYEAAAILILEQNNLGFQVIRGPAALQSLLAHQIPGDDLTIIEGLLKKSEIIYLADLHEQKHLIDKIQQTLKLPAAQFAYLRSWLILPLSAKGDLIGCLVLTHSQPDYYSRQSRTLSQAYANQVAVAIYNAQLYKQARDSAALEERNRLARELHDSVAQALYSISLFVDATRMALKTDKLRVAENHLEELSQLSREAMSDMRLMIFELRPPLLERVGLAAALQSRLEAVESRAGFQASFHTEGEIHLNSVQENELYRIAQEALNNIIKHAQANEVSVQLIGESGCLRMIIQDDGLGFSPSTIESGGGQGFRNMRERAASIGASCSFETIPGQGTKITVELKQ